MERIVYVYIFSGKKICLVDSGVKGSEKTIFDYIKKIGRAPEEISLLVLTHSHPDHIGAALAIKEKTNCLVAAHANARRWVEHIEAQYRERPVPGFYSLIQGSVGIKRLLKDGERIDLDTGLSMEILHTPGHSDDSIALWCKQEGALVCADTIPRPGDLPLYEDVEELVRSIQRLRSIKGIKLLLSSWDEPRRGRFACEAIDESLRYLQKIHKAVLEHYRRTSAPISAEFCKSILSEVGLNPASTNPLVVKAFESHLKAAQKHTFLQG